MIDYEAYRRIHHLHGSEGLSAAQIARRIGADARTVRFWLQEPVFRPRKRTPRPSKLDPYKPAIRRWLEQYPYSAQQVFQRLRDDGYEGGVGIVRQYVRRARPSKAPAFLTLHFEPGECAQVDWGQYGSVPVGNTRRRLSFFVMVLCYSRMMYVEFTVSQTMEHFLGCHVNAFEALGAAVPERIMVDNLKSAVLQRLSGLAPVFNPRYVDFAHHYGFEIAACNVGAGHEKGRVESAVGYVKKNLLAGLEITDFSQLNPIARQWLDEIANVRVHGETRRRPVEMFEEERPHLQPLPETVHDIGTVHGVRACNRFRVTFETNRYSVPAEYASRHLTLKAHPEHVCIYREERLVARHPRSYDRHRDFENPDHPKALLAQRRSAWQQRGLQRFLALAPCAEQYYAELRQRRLNPTHHIRKILALSEIHGGEATARALADALQLGALGSEYIANLLESRARRLDEPGPLHLTRAGDALELELPDPDLSDYDRHLDEETEQ